MEKFSTFFGNFSSGRLNQKSTLIIFRSEYVDIKILEWIGSIFNWQFCEKVKQLYLTSPTEPFSPSILCKRSTLLIGRTEYVNISIILIFHIRSSHIKTNANNLDRIRSSEINQRSPLTSSIEVYLRKIKKNSISHTHDLKICEYL